MPISAARPFVGVFGTIQPDVVHRLTREGEQDGFIERLLFSCPEPIEERQWRWQGISKEAKHAWDGIVQRLYSLEMAEPVDSGDDLWPRFMVFDQASAIAWESWYASHQHLRADLPSSMHACHAKLESYCARLVLLIELLWYADDAEHFVAARHGLELVEAAEGVFAHRRTPIADCTTSTPSR